MHKVKECKENQRISKKRKLNQLLGFLQVWSLLKGVITLTNNKKQDSLNLVLGTFANCPVGWYFEGPVFHPILVSWRNGAKYNLKSTQGQNPAKV